MTVHRARVIVLAAVVVGTSTLIPIVHARQTLDEQRTAAERGDPVAQLGVGYRYWVGQGGDQDDAEAGRWFRLAADCPTTQCFTIKSYRRRTSHPGTH